MPPNKFYWINGLREPDATKLSANPNASCGGRHLAFDDQGVVVFGVTNKPATMHVRGVIVRFSGH